MLIQTFLVFTLGSTSSFMSQNINFFISIGLMVVFVGILYKVIFKREGSNLYFLLLIGIIFGTLFESISSFMQVLIDPNEFMRIQDKMFASFNSINSELLMISFVLMILITLYFLKFIKYVMFYHLEKIRRSI